MHHRGVFAILPAAILLADQLSKAWIRVSLPPPGSGQSEKLVIIPKFFNIISVRNKGAAWGLFAESDYRLAFFATVTLCAFVLIGTYARQLRAGDRMLALSLAAVLGGAMGNFVDRLLYGEVTDFLQFFASGRPGVWCVQTFGSRYFPSFNVADIAICCGVFGFVIAAALTPPLQDDSAATPGNEESAAAPPQDDSAATPEMKDSAAPLRTEGETP